MKPKILRVRGPAAMLDDREQRIRALVRFVRKERRLREEEARHGAEARQRAEAAVRAAEEAVNRAANPPARHPAKPTLEDASASGGWIHASIEVTEEGRLTLTATAGKLKLGRVEETVAEGKTVHLKLPVTKAARAKLARHSLTITLKLSFRNAAGKVSTTTRTVRIGRSSS